MSPSRKNCPCEGSNTNCHRCFGKGFYELVAPEPKGSGAVRKRTKVTTSSIPEERFTRSLERPRGRTDKAAHGSVTTRPAPTRSGRQISAARRKAPKDVAKTKYVRCPACQAKVSSEKLESHVAAFHARPKKRMPTVSRTVPDLVACPKCNVRLKPESLKKHLRAKHGAFAEALRASLDRKRVELGLPTEADRLARLVRCPECSAMVTNVARHLRRAHGPSRPPKPRRPKERTRQPSTPVLAAEPENEASGPAVEGKAESRQEERRLDQSRDYWRIREGGKFGSHPSHDDFEDDSGP